MSMKKSKRWTLAAFLALFIALFGFNSVAQATTYGIFADVSSHQPDDVVFFKNLATNQVAGVVVKLTEGNGGYANDEAANQIASAQAAGLKVSVYHYAWYNGADEARGEADFFASQAAQLGLSKDTLMVDDVENSAMTNPYDDTVTFQKELASLGYSNQATYSMASWFWKNKLPRNYPIWVANYGVDQPGVDNAAAWQYTNNFNGQHVDMSYDFSGIFTTGSTITTPPASNNSNDGSTTTSPANPDTPVNTTPPASMSGIATINYIPNYGIALWNGYGANRTYAGRTLLTGTKWKVLAQTYANGEYWYNLGGNQWIEGQYTNIDTGTVGVPAVNSNGASNSKIVTIKYVPNYGIALWNGYGASRQYAGRTLMNATSWAVFGEKYVDGGFWYNLGGNQWIEGQYTTSPNGLPAFE